MTPSASTVPSVDSASPTVVSESVAQAGEDSRTPLLEPITSAGQVGNFHTDIEYERDAEGKLIPDVNTKYKYTAESTKLVREEKMQTIGDKLPKKKLPKNLRGHREENSGADLPILQFGLGVNNEHLIKYGERKALTTQEKYLREIGIDLDIPEAIVRHLGEACGAKLQIHEPYSPEHAWVISIYDSYTPLEIRAKGAEKERSIKALQSELGIKHEPLWYFDCDDPPEDHIGLDSHVAMDEA